jgi:AcrR family transcriptional regulator
MATYRKGRITKQRIINSSKKLFYQNGLKKTTCKAICDDAGVNVGLIPYYFKNKDSIASIIYTYFLIDTKEAVKLSFQKNKIDYELKYATAVENWVYMSLLLGDENYRRFYYELCRNNVLVDENTRIVEFFYKLHNNKYMLGFSNNEIKLIRVVSASSSMGLVEKYVEGYFDMPLEALIEYKIRNMYRIMELPMKDIDDIIKVSYDLFKNVVQIELSDYFRLSLVGSSSVISSGNNYQDATL